MSLVPNCCLPKTGSIGFQKNLRRFGITLSDLNDENLCILCQILLESPFIGNLEGLKIEKANDMRSKSKTAHIGNKSFAFLTELVSKAPYLEKLSLGTFQGINLKELNAFCRILPETCRGLTHFSLGNLQNDSRIFEIFSERFIENKTVFIGNLAVRR